MFNIRGINIGVSLRIEVIESSRLDEVSNIDGSRTEGAIQMIPILGH